MVYTNKNQETINKLHIFGNLLKLIYYCTFGFLMPAICEGTVETSWIFMVGWLDGTACKVHKRNLVDEKLEILSSPPSAYIAYL